MKRSLMLLLLAMLLLSGCGKRDINKIVLTTGFRSDEVFRIEDTSCSLSEIMVYLVDMQSSYSDRYGDGIWSTDKDDLTLSSGIKEAALSRISQVKTMNLLARDKGIALTDEERALASEAAGAYYETLDTNAIRAMNRITREALIRMYEEYALADKLYRFIIRDINPEISDDEARTITVQQIFVKADEETNAVGANAAERIAYEAYREAMNGREFRELIEYYSDAEEHTISFGKGEKEEAFETAAFNLGTDEISRVISTDDGYYILKCVTTFNREETDANKLKIITKRKREVFAQEYDSFAVSLAKDLNETLWGKVLLPEENSIRAGSFFDTYTEHFEGQFE